MPWSRHKWGSKQWYQCLCGHWLPGQGKVCHDCGWDFVQKRYSKPPKYNNRDDWNSSWERWLEDEVEKADKSDQDCFLPGRWRQQSPNTSDRDSDGQRQRNSGPGTGETSDMRSPRSPRSALKKDRGGESSGGESSAVSSTDAEILEVCVDDSPEMLERKQRVKMLRKILKVLHREEGDVARQSIKEAEEQVKALRYAIVNDLDPQTRIRTFTRLCETREKDLATAKKVAAEAAVTLKAAQEKAVLVENLLKDAQQNLAKAQKDARDRAKLEIPEDLILTRQQKQALEIASPQEAKDIIASLVVLQRMMKREKELEKEFEVQYSPARSAHGDAKMTASPAAASLGDDDEVLPESKRLKPGPMPPWPGEPTIATTPVASSGTTIVIEDTNEIPKTMQAILERKKAENAAARREQELLSTPPSRNEVRERRTKAVSRTPPDVRAARAIAQQQQQQPHPPKLCSEGFLAEGEVGENDDPR